MARWMVAPLLLCAVSVNSLPTNCANNAIPTDIIECGDLTAPCVDYSDIVISSRSYNCTKNIGDFTELIVKCRHFTEKYNNSAILKPAWDAVLGLCNSAWGGNGRGKRDVQTQDWDQIHQEVERARKTVEKAKRMEEMVDRMSNSGSRIDSPDFFDDVNAQIKKEEAKRQAETKKIRIWALLGVLAVGFACIACCVHCHNKTRAAAQDDTDPLQYRHLVEESPEFTSSGHTTDNC